MAELDTLLELPGYSRDEQLWSCAVCARAQPSWRSVLIGGLVVCRERDFCHDAAKRMARAARPAAAPPPPPPRQARPARKRAPALASAPRPPTPAQDGPRPPRLPYAVRPPAPPPAAAIDVIVTMRQRAARGHK